jgi:DNA-binding PadR family transcriptional regulator
MSFAYSVRVVSERMTFVGCMESNNLIDSRRVTNGKKMSTVYRPTHRGVQFCTDILDPFEKMFPRKGANQINK